MITIMLVPILKSSAFKLTFAKDGSKLRLGTIHIAQGVAGTSAMLYLLAS